MKNNKKKKRKMGSMLHILQYILKYKLILIFIAICMLIANIAGLAIPDLTGKMINAITEQSEQSIFSRLFPLAMEMIIASIIMWLLTALQNSLMVTIGQNVIVDLRHDVFDRLEHLPVSYFDGTTKGNILSIVITDISNVSDTISSDLVTVITGIVVLIGSLSMMLKINGMLTLVFAITIPLMAISTYFISKNARRLHHDRKNKFGELCGYSEEMITAQRTIKVYGLEDQNNQTFDDTSCDLRKKATKASFCSGLMMPANQGINNLNFTLICAFGAFLVLNGKINLGDISAFILYAKKFSAPIVDTSNIISMLQASFAACDRIFGILNTPPEETEETKSKEISITEKPKGDIVFNHAKFQYNPDTIVLRDIDFHIKPGQKIAIVGSTGAGKTTIISLLMRFYKLTDGSILLDGKDISKLRLDDLRKSFALVLQDSWLFEGSVFDNITYALPDDKKDIHKIKKLCKDIHVDSFINQLPYGYDTIMHSESGGLSQGQKQLINIARAFLCNPSVFILDEATSSVDPQTEAKIQDITNRVIKGRTSIIIAHRLSTILTADCILVLKDGYVQEQGTHSQLLAKNGLYKEIYESQFQQS